MKSDYESFRNHLARISDLSHASAVLEWDQETYMPEGAVEARAHQIATLRTLAHELLVSDETRRMMEYLEGDRPDLDHTVSTDERAALLRIARRDFDRASRIPPDLVTRMAETTSLARNAWKAARDTSNFPLFAPHLQTIRNLLLEQAEAIGFDDHPYDALLDEYEPGMKTATVRRIFGDLKKELVPIVAAISGCQAPDDSVLHRFYPHQAQWDFGLEVIRNFGYDFQKGRQDVSAHPFTTTFSISDVRLTTRIDEHFFNPGFFGTLHEAGHGMYEQGVDPALERSPLADGTSLGMHESQSRLWENQVGRSRAFWRHYYPIAQTHFPEALTDVSPDTFYRAINRVANSLIRVEADEVTYNLHIMVRFELECELMDGNLGIHELPQAWNDRMEAYLGVRPANDAEGVLQDIHWSLGAIGYFPTYALGNLMSAQFFRTASTRLVNLDSRFESGDFSALREWLRTNIHRFGRKKPAETILRDTTGEDLSIDSWIQYIRSKYEELYGLQ